MILCKYWQVEAHLPLRQRRDDLSRSVDGAVTLPYLVS